MFYWFQIDQTKIGGVTLILYGLFTTQQMSKRGLTSAGRNPAFKTPYTPFPIHILNRLDMRIRHVSCKIYHTYKKNLRKSRLSDRFFGLFLVISEVLYSKNSDFEAFSVLGENYAFYHFVCHRYT